MPSTRLNVRIDAESSKVWDVLIGHAYDESYSPGVGKIDARQKEPVRVPPSWCIATRVVAWDEGGDCAFETYATGLPAHIESLHFALDPNGESTTVTLTATYDIEREPMNALRWFSVSRTLARRLARNLQHLKEAVEAAEPDVTTELIAA